MRIVDQEAIERHGAERFRSEFHYAKFEYWRSAKLLRYLTRANITHLGSVLDDPQTSLQGFQRFTETVKSYMAIKTGVSLATGTAVTVWLIVLGVDYPLLWGMLAFLLNYVPNIGSIIAAVPAVLLALVQLGIGSAAVTLAGIMVINIVMGSVIEPRFMGRGLGLSTLVVFLSLVFWGWVLGPVGMLLSVPLTMTVKIALDSGDDTRWIAIFLGPDDRSHDAHPGGDDPDSSPHESGKSGD